VAATAATAGGPLGPVGELADGLVAADVTEAGEARCLASL